MRSLKGDSINAAGFHFWGVMEKVFVELPDRRARGSELSSAGCSLDFWGDRFMKVNWNLGSAELPVGGRGHVKVVSEEIPDERQAVEGDSFLHIQVETDSSAPVLKTEGLNLREKLG